jgi:hypothetical protein
MPDPKTEELRLEQIERAREERDREETAGDRPEQHTAERRAEKADYLREKLAERAEAEDEAADGD